MVRKYYHFVGEKDTKNNVCFVRGAWEKFRRLPEHKDIKYVIVWSDGGPKHFKLTEGLFYFSCISTPTFRINSYNFFGAYHGQSGCDAAAFCGKRRINVKVRDEGWVMDTAAKLCEAINTLKNTQATPVWIYDPNKHKPPTMDGITKGFMFIPHGPGDITSFLHSTVFCAATEIQRYRISSETVLWDNQWVRT